MLISDDANCLMLVNSKKKKGKQREVIWGRGDLKTYVYQKV